jgi:VWFA-related protein
VPVTDAATAPAEQRRRATFSSSVTYVPVHVSVADTDATDLRDVAASEFRVYEDDVEQKIDRVLSLSQPFNMVLLVDASTSMRANVGRIQEALLGFVDAVRQDDQLMLVSFHRLVFEQAALTKDRVRTRQAVYQIDKRDGTRLYDAIRLSAQRLPPASVARKAIVLVTDGVDTESRFADAASTLAWATEADIPIYVVQYEASEDDDVVVRTVPSSAPRFLERPLPADTVARAREFLERLAANSGGQVYRATTLNGLADALRRVAHDLSVLYTVCYYPSNQSQDGTYRRLRVEVTRPGAKVRARLGYRAARRAAGAR